MQIWVNPPSTPLPIARSPLRLAIGTPAGPGTNSWRVWTQGEDVYVKCRDNFAELKASLHASGNWRFGFIKEFADSRPDLIPPEQDRVWTKWQPTFGNGVRYVVGLQIVALTPTLYLGRSDRGSWPNSVVFVEPPDAADHMSVVSVAVVEGHRALRMREGVRGAVIAMMPLGDERTVQIVATHEPIGETPTRIEEAASQAVSKMGGADSMPSQGVLLLHGKRGETIPWVTAVRIQKLEQTH